MPNTFITPGVIASRGLATLYNSTVLAALVSRDFTDAFSQKVGDTINIRKPATFTAEVFDRANGVTYQDITETSIPLVLDTIANTSFLVTDEEMTLEISQFQEQLLTPAMESIAQKVDGDLAETLVDAAEGSGGGGTASATGSTEANRAFIDARTILSRNKLPVNNRLSVLSPEGVAKTLQDEHLLRVDASGSTDALRNGIVGRLVGFETYESQVFGQGAGDRGQADGVAFHRDSVVAAIRPLDTPKGLPPSNVSVQSYRGLSLRVTYDYSHKYKQDLVSVDLLYGIKAVRPEGVVQLNLGQGS